MTSVNNRPEILSKLGVGSGLDTSALIETLVEAEIAGPKEQLDSFPITDSAVGCLWFSSRAASRVRDNKGAPQKHNGNHVFLIILL